eukprot:1155186-Pelagomonas_calceolata.AAC.5
MLLEAFSRCEEYCHKVASTKRVWPRAFADLDKEVMSRFILQAHFFKVESCKCLGGSNIFNKRCMLKFKMRNMLSSIAGVQVDTDCLLVSWSVIAPFASSKLPCRQVSRGVVSV